MKRILIMISLCAMLLFMGSIAICEGEYRTLVKNDYGNDVLELKSRLKKLGYFSSSTTINNKYTEDTITRVKAFEKACGLPETGIATPALQALLFSDDAINKNTKKNVSGNAPVLDEEAYPASDYRNMAEGDVGNDVLTFKKELYSLGFFTAKAETATYNATMTRAVKALQAACELPETGEVDAELQKAILEGESKIASNKPVPTPVPKATPKPTSTPKGPSNVVELPALNADGFLADEEVEPFVFADRDDGQWYYISQDLHIEIVRKTNTLQKKTWFEAEIWCTENSLPQSFLAQGSRQPGHNYITPKEFAKQYNMVFAISDDFYGYRWYNKITQGIIIRNGDVKSDQTYPANTKKWPSLEVLAMFEDGSMKVYESDEHTAEEYLAMGVTDTYAFGPILVRDGVIDQALYSKNVVYYTDTEPRMALGYVEPGHYVIVCVKGRTKDSDGVTIPWLAERMKALGCVNALNLDGGNTIEIYFMGDVLNKIVNSTSLRDLSSMIGFSAK